MQLRSQYSLREMSALTGISFKSLQHMADRGKLATVTVTGEKGKGVVRYVSLETLQRLPLWNSILLKASVEQVVKERS